MIASWTKQTGGPVGGSRLRAQTSVPACTADLGLPPPADAVISATFGAIYLGMVGMGGLSCRGWDNLFASEGGIVSSAAATQAFLLSPTLTHPPRRTFAINTVSFLPVFHCLKGFTSAVSHSLTHSLVLILSNKDNHGIFPYYKLQIVPKAYSFNNSELPETTAPAPNFHNSPISIQISKGSYHVHANTASRL